jgi:hypothetical protein
MGERREREGVSERGKVNHVRGSKEDDGEKERLTLLPDTRQIRPSGYASCHAETADATV